MYRQLWHPLVAALGTLILTCATALAASGPQTAWNVFTLPNPEITPGRRNYAPVDCKADPEACAKDFRFWEEWDFRDCQNTMDPTLSRAVHSQGRYTGVTLILPFGNTPASWNNIELMYQSAAAKGVQLQVVLFPPNGSMGRSTATCTRRTLRPDASGCRARPPPWLTRSC